jgi:hypothetical protein
LPSPGRTEGSPEIRNRIRNPAPVGVCGSLPYLRDAQSAMKRSRPFLVNGCSTICVSTL